MSTSSGKLLIVAMLGAGVLAAAASWWFRYEATHEAARFWGPAAATLIRDASQVDLLALQPSGELPQNSGPIVASVVWQIDNSLDITHAPGLTHLRNALLEDRSFAWPARAVPADREWTHGLRFHADSGPPFTILFTSDFNTAVACVNDTAASQAVSCEPIADGLGEVFREWTHQTPGER